MNDNNSSCKTKVGYVLAGIGAIMVIIVLVKSFIIGYYARDLAWIFPVGLGGVGLFLLGCKLADLIEPKDKK